MATDEDRFQTDHTSRLYGRCRAFLKKKKKKKKHTGRYNLYINNKLL